MSKYKGIDIQFDSDTNEKYLCIFDVSSVGIIVDNIVSNAKRPLHLYCILSFPMKRMASVLIFLTMVEVWIH